VTILGDFFKEVARGWGANPGPLDFIYFLIFTTLPLSHSGSPYWANSLLCAVFENDREVDKIFGLLFQQF
jgi:hypothetical protein